MKQKILTQLVTKFPGVDKKFLGLWADKMSAKVTEESAIDDALSALDDLPVSITDLAAEWQRNGDQRVTAAKAEWDKKKPGEPNQPTPPTPPANEPPADMPEWAKVFQKSIEGLSQTVTTLAKEKQQTTMQALAAQKLKDINPTFYKGRVFPEKEEELDAWVQEVTDDYAAFTQDMQSKGIAVVVPGGGSQTQQQVTEKKTEADIKAFAEQQKKALNLEQQKTT